LALVAASPAFAQSGLLEGPFVPGTGVYATVPGGTFELTDPLTGWGDHLNIATITTATTPPMRGDQVGLVSGWSTGWYAVHKSLDNALVAGQSYVLSGFFRAEEPGGSIAIDIGNYGGRAWYQTAQTALASDQGTTGKWYFGYATFVADNPSMRVRLVRNGPTVERARSFFDDVAVTPVGQFRAPTPVPEPATLLALGAGVVALIRRRRGNRRAS
jgi:hypothetical protein